MKDFVVVLGAGSIGQAVARRVGADAEPCGLRREYVERRRILTPISSRARAKGDDCR